VPFGDRGGDTGRWRGTDRPARPAETAARSEAEAAELVGPEEELIAGRRPVEEAFVARRPALRLLVVPNRRQALERIVLHATSLRIPIVEVEGGTLTSVAGFDGHQGVALVVRPRTWASIEDVLGRAAARGEPPFVLVLDSLEDPQNVGTLLRSAEAVGVHGVVFPTHHQAPLSPAAVKASAGATEHLLLVPVDDLPGALADLHVRGVRLVGADEDAPLTGRQADLRGPLALVVGSEGQGIGPAVRRRLDLSIRIPMRGAIGSLNAAVAGSVLLFEVLEQRGEAPTEPRPPRGDPLPAPTAAPAAEATPMPLAAEATEATDASVTSKRRTRRTTPAEAETVPAPAAPARRTRSVARPAPIPPATEPPEPATPKRRTRSEAPATTATEATEPTTAPVRRTRKAAPSAAATEEAAAAPKGPTRQATSARTEEVPAPATRARRTRGAVPAGDQPAAGPTPVPAKRTRAKRATAVEPAADDLLPGGPAPSSEGSDLA
jgi:23S rRNA (guanosine2251-2'-O)-methyltransferase